MVQSSLPPNNATEKKSMATSQADSQKKLVELRAKLLANRPRSAASQRSGTPSKSKELPIQPKNTPQGQGKEKTGSGNSVQSNTQIEARSGTNANVSTQVSTFASLFMNLFPTFVRAHCTVESLSPGSRACHVVL